MNLKRYDFNKPSGWASILFISIAISFVIFAIVYLAEGSGWLASYKDDPVSTYQRVGNNWVRGGVIALLASTALFTLSYFLLRKNRKNPKPHAPVWHRLDLNNPKGYMGLVLIAVAFTFFFNAALYRYEYIAWTLSAIGTLTKWNLVEAAAWAEAARNMALIGALCSASGLTLLALNLKKHP